MKPLDDLEFQKIAAARVQDAIDYIDDEVAEARERLTRAYNGDLSDVLPKKKGRSGVVSYDVRDTVQQLLPSLLRIFAAQERVVEFVPNGAEDIEAAAQATDYVNHIFRHDNPGFAILHDVFKDALVRKAGIVKVWWEKETRVEAKSFEGIAEDVFMAFAMEAEADEGIEITDHEVREDGAHNFTVETRKESGKAKVASLPVEEFIISRNARSLDDTDLVAHRCYTSVGDLAAMGYDFDEMLELSTSDDGLSFNEEREARQPLADQYDGEDTLDPAMRKVLYIEAYMRCDADGDGVIEMRKVCMAGSAYKVIHQEMVDDHPFAAFIPEPEPHTFFGLCPADSVYDIQLIRTQVMRLGLDGLGQVITPRLVALTNAGLNMDHVLDNHVGGVVLANRPDALTPLQTDKAAPQMAFETYRIFGEVRQDRTGQNQASMGLTPDALQSVSRIAANELVQAAQQRVEMIARFFAEGGMKRLFRLLLRLVTRYQDKERIIRLRNKWVPMDPRQWAPDMDVTINVGLGTGNVEEKAVFFDKMLQIQQAIMQMAGPQNPWVDPEKIRNTLEDAVESTGRQFERYFLGRDEWQQMQQMLAQQPPKPEKTDPAEKLAQAQIQVEQMKAQADIQNQREKTQADMISQRLKDDRERDELDADIVLKAAKLGIAPEQTLAFIRQQRPLTPSGGM